MYINHKDLQDLSEMYVDICEGKFVPGKTKLRPRSERGDEETPAQKRRREAEKKRREALQSAADNILAGLQSGSRPKTSEPPKEDESTPQGKVRRLPKGQKRDMTAAAANEIIRQLQSNSYEYEGEILDERKRREPRWWDDDGDGIGWEEGEVSGKFKKKKKKKVAKESFSNWRDELFEVVDDKDENPQIKEKKVKNKVKTSAIGSGIKIGEAVEELGGTLIEMIELDDIDFIIEDVYSELQEEGYDEEDIEDALEYALVEAQVTYGHDTQSPRKELMKKAKGRLRFLGRKIREKLGSAKKAARYKTAQAQVAAYNKGRELAQTAGDTTRKTRQAISDAPKKAKKSVKSRIKNLAQRVVDRMSEEYELQEKSLSVSQQQAAGAALAAKRGEISPSELKGASLEMYKSMSEKDLRDFAKTKHEGLPRKKVSEQTVNPVDKKRLENEKQRQRLLKIQQKIEQDILRKQKMGQLPVGSASTITAQEAYEILINSLIENEIADDYDSAELMLESLSDNFIEVIFEDYFEEAKLPRSQKQGKKVRQSRTLKLTDCDDCTHDQSHPDAAKIDLKDKASGKTISRLTPGQFAHHTPSDSQSYGFDDFRSTKKVKDTTKPNKKIVTALNKEEYEQIDERIRRYPQQRAITARGSMDDNRGFVDDMKKRIGVKNLKSVSFTGNMPRTDKSGKKVGGPEKKAVVAKHIAKKNPDAKKIDFYDDHQGNVEAVADTLAKSGKKGRKRVSGPKVRGFVAKPDESGEVRPVRLGGEGSSSGRRGVRPSTQPTSQREGQRRRKKG
jgi:hypothetical protein